MYRNVATEMSPDRKVLFRVTSQLLWLIKL